MDVAESEAFFNCIAKKEYPYEC